MTLIQLNQDMLLEFITNLRKAAPPIYPESEEDFQLANQWAEISKYITEIVEPISHLPGFDAESVHWARLESGYRRDVKDYENRRQD